VLRHQIVIDASVGIALSPDDGHDADQLLKSADMALYRAKEDGSYRRILVTEGIRRQRIEHAI
jgi:GGDEF domain-containing protein